MNLALKVLKSRFFNSVNLINVCFFVTYKCNANCIFCDLGNKTTKLPELTLLQIREILRELKSLDVRRVSLVGGEPLLREELPEIITAVRNNKMSVSLTTNGFITRGDVLKSRPDEINVSLDFVDRRHEKYRRVKDALEKVYNSIEFYANNKRVYNYHLGMIIVLMKENLDHISDVVRFAREAKVDKVAIQPVIMPQIRDKNKIDRFFGEEELLKFEEVLHHLKGKYRGLITTSKLFLFSIPKYFYGPGHHTLHCFAGGTMLNIDPSGEIFPCLFMESAGNVQEHPLQNILMSPKYQKLHLSARKRNCPDCLCPDIFEPNLLFYPFHWHELVRKYLRHKK